MSPETHTDKNPRASRTTRGLLGLGLVILLVAGAFASGMHIGTSEAEGRSLHASIIGSLFGPPSTPDQSADLSEFWQVWNLMEEKFVASGTSTPITDETRLRGAVEGLVGSYGDPYTVFLPPREAESFSENISGNFSGVGMEVGMRGDRVTVIAPLPDTPAKRAGVVAGDTITAIDGTDTDDMSIDEAVEHIRGEKGTDVVLTIFREGETELIDIAITRDTITIPTLDTDVRDDVFIITLYSFNAKANELMQDALIEFVKSDADKLILDVRGNPGGFLQSAVSIAGYFLPSGKVIVREDFGDERDEQLYRSHGKTLREYAPEEMVVLIDGGSASASEILAGALSQHDAATLIGDTTFGKGSVQELVELPEGSSLKVTIARWLTPDGTSISEGGLAPDIAIPRTPQQVLAGEDPQLEAALEFIRGNASAEALQEAYATSSQPTVE